LAVTVDDVKARIADAMHQDVGSLPAYAAGLAGLALSKAEADLSTFLSDAGYSPALAARMRASDRDPWVLMQSLYWALVSGELVDSEQSLRNLGFTLLDQRKAPPAIPFYDEAGAFVLPDLVTGLVGHGDSKARSSFVDSATGQFKAW
jgi:hypothetical protein